jgi:hypothetical protein
MVTRITPARPPSGPGVESISLWPWCVTAAVLGSPAVVLALWGLLHRVPGFAPWLADNLRAVVGVEAVAELEDLAYGAEDRVLQIWRRGERPQARWALPPVSAAAPSTVPADPGQLPLPAFDPSDVGPVHQSWSAPGDGVWVPLSSADGEPVRMKKTLLHPDQSRSWAELFVVAVDLARVELKLVAGTREPQATEAEAVAVARPGRVPEAEEATVLAAFNGGFKTEHGRYGMRVNGVTLVSAQDEACTIAFYNDHSLKVASWPKIAAEQADMAWWRETPNCMYEDGKLHWRLAEGLAHRWGATVDGETVIRRSALGIDAAGKTLYVGISNHTTAATIAHGMRHAGAVTVAQLDINFSYPKFVTFEKSPSGARIAIPLAQGFEFSEDEYIRKPSSRDFFYLLPAAPDRRTARQ